MTIGKTSIMLSLRASSQVPDIWWIPIRNIWPMKKRIKKNEKSSQHRSQNFLFSPLAEMASEAKMWPSRSHFKEQVTCWVTEKLSDIHEYVGGGWLRIFWMYWRKASKNSLKKKCRIILWKQNIFRKYKASGYAGVEAIFERDQRNQKFIWGMYDRICGIFCRKTR